MVDSGAHISLVKSEKLLSTAEFESRDRVRVKSVERSIIETNGTLETQVRKGDMSIPYRLQLESEQVDLKGDGILRRDCLTAMRARICYRETALIFRYRRVLVRKKLTPLPGAERGTPKRQKGEQNHPPSQNRTDSASTGGRRNVGTRGHSRESRANARSIRGREPGQSR